MKSKGYKFPCSCGRLCRVFKNHTNWYFVCGCGVGFHLFRDLKRLLGFCHFIDVILILDEIEDI
jgi:hypothetical protein